ncbi:S8 family serine peptidase [Bacillus sp. AFS088145]|uniref:S8 family serine peptidase n=1 Tax=Bacillus sp. AFS088145 TaxID=2033514 RepID=UPI0025703C1A|nr:S8 family serine peptidase [Bacillus sp. AFS088145]
MESLKKRKLFPYKVISTVGLSVLLFSTTVFAEGANNPIALSNGEKTNRNISDYIKKGLLSQQSENKSGKSDRDGYKDLYNSGKDQIRKFKPDEKVRLIVEVDSPVVTSTVSEETKEKEFKIKQDKVINSLNKTKKNIHVKHRFFTGFNGFSTETEYKNMKEIKSIQGVKNIHIARVFQPSMGASKELVQAQKVWESYGYQGEGLVVGVIDSGIDWTHKDLTITDKGKQQEKWTKENIQGKFAETNVNEIWYSDKVPTGYDWADDDTDVIPGEYGSPHGTHVSGTIGANGDETSDGVKGIAPGVQLLAEKVFSDYGGGAYEDDLIAGIQHAVTMGADVINMSLGSDSGWVGEEDDPVQKAIRQATEQGTLVVVAGGNAAYSTKNNFLQSSLLPYAENPDIGTVGSPGVSPFALSVASYENSKVHMDSLKSTTGEIFPYKNQAGNSLTDVLEKGKNYDFVYVGEGRSADYAGKDVKGKIVVTKPIPPYGYNGNVEFQQQAQNRGAVALIQVPPTNLPDFADIDFSPYFLTSVTTSKTIGNDLISKLASGQKISMQLSGGTYVDNENKNKMSSFSSYGAPYTLDFKPEISAPGGNIYSTIPGNKYDVYSGTSMATPHVAGGSALLLQALYQKGLTHSEDTVLKAKIALMNTAKVVMDPSTNSEIPYSPRVQGSGLMQIKNAINTPVIVTNKNTPLEQAGAVALKEIKNDRAIFNLNVESLETKKSKEEYEYTVNVDLLTDGTVTKQFDLDGDGTLDSKDYLTLLSKRIEGASVYVNGEKLSSTDGAKLIIKAGQEKNLNVEIRLPRNLRKNSFVEGFVRLTPVGNDQEKAVPLTVPYMGFLGDWTQPKNIDPAPWSDGVFIGYTVLWDDVSDAPLGFDGRTGTFNFDHMTISPNTFAPGVFPSFQALRNLKETEMYIEDQKGKRVKWLGNFSEFTADGSPFKFTKNSMASGDLYYKFDEYSAPNYTWNETNENGDFVPDGNYNYVIKSTFDYKNAKPQYVKLPVKVDSTAVKISNIQVNPKNGKYEISFNATDSANSSGYKGAIVYVNGDYYETNEGETTITVSTEPKGIVVMGYDYAYNQSYAVWGDESYIDYSMVLSWFYVSGTNVNANNPAQITGYANNRVDWKIYVKDSKGNIIETKDILNEHTLRMKWTPDPNVPDGTYYISAGVTTKDGFKVTTESKKVTVNR